MPDPNHCDGEAVPGEQGGGGGGLGAPPRVQEYVGGDSDLWQDVVLGTPAFTLGFCLSLFLPPSALDGELNGLLLLNAGVQARQLFRGLL